MLYVIWTKGPLSRLKWVLGMHWQFTADKQNSTNSALTSRHYIMFIMSIMCGIIYKNVFCSIFNHQEEKQRILDHSRVWREAVYRVLIVDENLKSQKIQKGNAFIKGYLNIDFITHVQAGNKMIIKRCMRT